MSTTSQPDWRLIVGFAASVVAHGLIAAVLGGAALTGESVAERPPDLEMKAPQIRPGVDQSRAVTINWIGFEEATPHEARLAETDQPSLVRGPEPEPAPETPPATAAPPPIPLAQVADAEPLPMLPLPLNTLDDLLARLEQAAPPTRPTVTPPQTREQSEPQEAVKPLDDAPSPATSAGGGPKESSPTAQRKPTEIRPGRPIAIEGLEIDTVAPQFSAITRFTAYPGNPVVRVVFSAKGEVVTAEVVQSSGYANVDRPILDAIYRWKAKGRQLDSLRETDPEQKVEFEFRIVLQ